MNLVFLFPGQGSQAVGMCAAMIRDYPSVARRLAQGSDLVATNLQTLIERGPPQALAQTHIAQVAIYCLSFALYELLIEAGCRCTLMAGHSLGQFTALAASGAMDFDQGLALVGARGAAMHAANQSVDGAMLAVQGAEQLKSLKHLMEGVGGCWVANRNAPGQHVLAGRRSSLHMMRLRLQENGVSSCWLEVAGAYHTPLMQGAADRFGDAIDAAVLDDALIPVVANSSASIIVTREQIIDELHAHMLASVNWAGTMQIIAGCSPALLVEIGPGRVLKGLALRNRPDLKCMTTGSPAEFNAALHSLQELACLS